ncbi:hypothetical protein BDN72DRAFT_846779 [Pluteus cervinus]|uniref:Uncharacterized protein n=1 Tax=Pluteus cervinus TaxID=181527 RepID=A0ACD3AF00_9AGAR|nr:hypothetical protein BDN72DRAFT_846779 [Pluteus cervinus]
MRLSTHSHTFSLQNPSSTTLKRDSHYHDISHHLDTVVIFSDPALTTTISCRDR